MGRRGLAIAAVTVVVAGLLAGGGAVASDLDEPLRPHLDHASDRVFALPLPLAITPTRAPTAADPLRVMIVGDSLMYDATPGITAALESTGVVHVYENAILGFGLVWGWPWRTEWPRLVADERPDVVIAMLGTWDHDAAIGRGAEWYRGLVDQAATILMAGGARLIWLGYPRVRSTFHTFLRPAPDHPSSHSEIGRQFVDAIFATLPATFRGRAAYLPLDAVLDGPGGAYTSFLRDDAGVLHRARKKDGAHFCPFGSQQLGRYLDTALGAAFALPPPTSTWMFGPWRDKYQFVDPPDGCPNDAASPPSDDLPPPGL